MTLPLQQTQELETPNYQEHQVSALIYSFINPNATYRKEYLSFDTIERAYQANHRKITKKTKYLSDKAKKILAPVIQKLLRGETVLLNSKYISQITGCEARQNRNILNELKGILKIKHRKFIRVNGRIFKGYYLFKFTPAILYELYPTEEKGNGNKFPLHIQNNKNIEDIDLKSNFLQNSQEAKITPIETVKFKKRVPNKRKKRTNAEKKARIYHFNQYKEPQNLKHHYPLNKDDNAKLQSLSGRDFSLNAMNEILLDMSKRVDRTFCSKAQFISYFGKCLRFEKRDAVQTSTNNFHIKANKTAEELKELAIEKDMDQYLDKTEQQNITNRTDETQFKARIAAKFSKSVAYNFLKSLRFIRKMSNVLELHLLHLVSLTPSEEMRLLWEAQSIGGYSDVENIEFVI